MRRGFLRLRRVSRSSANTVTLLMTLRSERKRSMKLLPSKPCRKQKAMQDANAEMDYGTAAAQLAGLLLSYAPCAS